MAYDLELADRVRSALATEPTVREVRMFGGLSFMVDEAMVVNVGSAGDLLVRVDPQRHEDYLRVEGASSAEMGAGRTMGKGWLVVDADAVAADEDLASWIRLALDFNRRTAGDRPRRRKKPKAAERADVSLDDVRDAIDRLDDQIVSLLARRQHWVKEAARHKRDSAAVHAPDRRARVLARLQERAVAEGVEPGVVAAVYTAMIDEFVRVELREHEAGGGVG